MNGTMFDSLREQVRGQVITPGDAGYDEARAVHNGMIDKRPAAVVRVSQVADVIASVNFARDNSLDLAIRGGGHSAPGFGTWDDALVIDFANTTGCEPWYPVSGFGRGGDQRRMETGHFGGRFPEGCESGRLG